MAFDDYACALMRRKALQGKQCVILPATDQLAAQITDDRTSLRLITRVNVAFFTAAEHARYAQLRKEHRSHA